MDDTENNVTSETVQTYTEAFQSVVNHASSLGLIITGIFIGAALLMIIQRKYQFVSSKDVDIAKEMARLSAELKHTSQNHDECMNALSQYRVVADEVIHARLTTNLSTRKDHNG